MLGSLYSKCHKNPCPFSHSSEVKDRAELGCPPGEIFKKPSKLRLEITHEYQAQRAWPKHFAGPEFEIVVSSLQTVLSSRFNKREAGGNQLLRNMVRIIPRKRY